ncbi:hypothetical protein C8J57DRAFT_1629302 [Mycena rebaudengoi]|nr:hypothetical protein C8J57DRAFT_1629302 [Mycena rebaudengoi]
MSSPQNTQPPLQSPLPPHDSDHTTLRVWTKMSAREYKALGLEDDPVRRWVLAELYPLYMAAVRAGSISGARENYVKTTLFDVFEETWQFAAKNYNIGPFKEASIISGFIIFGASKLWLMIKNHYDTTDKPPRPMKHTNGSAERKPRVVSAIAMFKKEHEAEIARERDTEAVRLAAVGEPVTHPLALYNGSDASVKAEMEEHAHRANKVIDAGPTPDDIAKNQETVDIAIIKKLKSLMGHGWTGHGDMVFFVRASFVNHDNKIATLCLAVGPKYTVEPYASSREDQETKEFTEYAVKVLSTDAAAPPTEPTLEVDGAGNAVLPKIKTKNTPSETLPQLLKGYATFTHPAIEHTTTSVVLVNADGSQVDLDNASREELMLFYDQICQLRKTGTDVSVTVGTGKALADDADPRGGASCQPAGGLGAPVNDVPGWRNLSTVPHAIAPAHSDDSPTALVNLGRLPANVIIASGDAATLLPDTTLPGANAVIDIEPNVEPVVPPAVDIADDSPTAVVNPGRLPANVDIASGNAATLLPNITLPGASAVTDIEPNVEPVIPPAVNIADVGAIVDVQPQFASSLSSLSSTAGQQVTNNLHLGKRKRVTTHDDASAGKSAKRQALYELRLLQSDPSSQQRNRMTKENKLPTEPRRSTRSKDKASLPASKPVLNKSGNIRGWKGFAAVDDDGNEVSPEEYDVRRKVNV